MKTFESVEFCYDTNAVVTVVNIETHPVWGLTGINTETITGNIDYLNKQMQRLQFNCIRQGYKITNAGYGFIVAKHETKHLTVFAKVDIPRIFAIPLEKTNTNLKN